MSVPYQNGQSDPAEYNYRTGRSPLLNRRNRTVGLIVAFVAIVLMLAAMAYIKWYGGINKGPMKPLHSSLVSSLQIGLRA
jgi:hypothetical protein